MSHITAQEEIVKQAHKLFVDWLEGYDKELQAAYKVPANFDIDSFTDEEIEAAREALHKDGEGEPCEWCVLDALMQAQEELAGEAAPAAPAVTGSTLGGMEGRR